MNILISLLGTTLDAHGHGSARWNAWRPSVALAMQDDLPKKNSNDSDRLSKYLAHFGLDFHAVIEHSAPKWNTQHTDRTGSTAQYTGADERKRECRSADRAAFSVSSNSIF